MKNREFDLMAKPTKMTKIKDKRLKKWPSSKELRDKYRKIEEMGLNKW